MLTISDMGHIMSDLTTDLPYCGPTYLSINGAKKCGQSSPYSISSPVELTGPGESVEFRLKAWNGETIDFGMEGILIYTGVELPEGPPPPNTPPPNTPPPYTPPSYTTPSLTTNSPPTFVNAGSLNHNVDICAGNYKYTATGSGSIK
jgi:hypothetical protein